MRASPDEQASQPVHETGPFVPPVTARAVTGGPDDLGRL